MKVCLICFNGGRIAAGIFCLLACAATWMPYEVCGQQNAALVTVTPELMPPPIKLLPGNLRTSLNAARDLKARVRLALELTGEVLQRAEQLTSGQRYDAATSELGVYQALVEDTLQFLREGSTGNNKSRDLYRRIEQTLRAQASRIEAIRRLTPADYAVSFRAVFNTAKQARTEALNAFYGDTVVRDDDAENEKLSPDESSAGKNAAETPTNQSPQQP